MNDDIPTPVGGAIFEYCERRLCLAAANPIRKSSPTYKSLYYNFLQWYINNINDDTLLLSTERSTDGIVYITQHNVEQYYRIEVINRNGKKDTIMKKFYALNWYREKVEHTVGISLVISPIIKAACDTQAMHHSKRSNLVHAGTDPHKGLKDLMSESDNIKLIKYIWSDRPDSQDLSFSYLWGRNAGVRGDSSRKFVLSDLNLSYGFGPENYAPRNRTLLLVLRQGFIHKDRYTTDKQVGVQRHRDYRQCTAFATGLLLIMKLRALGNEINFLHVNKKTSRASWWDIQLNAYDTYSKEEAAIRQVYAGTGVDAGKVTHHRLQAVQHAGSQGCQPWQVSTMTKHVHDKLNMSYLPEVEIETIKIMSGFRKASTNCYEYDIVLYFYICI